MAWPSDMNAIEEMIMDNMYPSSQEEVEEEEDNEEDESEDEDEDDASEGHNSASNSEEDIDAASEEETESANTSVQPDDYPLVGGKPEEVQPDPGRVLISTSRALGILEVLENVLTLASTDTQAKAARTCREWAEVALRRLWRDLKSLFPLANLIAPLQKGYMGWQLPHDHDYSATNWHRVLVYGSYVRTVNAENVDVLASTMTTLSTMACTPFILPTLANLRVTIRQASDIVAIMPILSPSITQLAIHFSQGIHPEAIIGFLRSSSARLIYITKLEFTCHQPVTAISVHLCNWMTRFLYLQSITLPPFYLSQEVVARLSILPRLSAVMVNWTMNTPIIDAGMQFTFQALEVPHSNTVLLPDPSPPWFTPEILQPVGRTFTALRTLDVQMSEDDFIFLFYNFPDCLEQLSKLSISCPDLSGNDVLGEMMDLLAEACAGIVTLELNLFRPTKFIEQLGGPVALTFAPLRYLLRCTSLVSFSVSCDLPIRLVDQDIQSMAEAWPHLARLSITPDPMAAVAKTSEGNPLATLRTLALAFPKLQWLGLFFSPLLDDEQFNSANCLVDEVTWDLDVLNVGQSRIRTEAVHEYAFIFGSLFKPGTLVVQSAEPWYRNGRPLAMEDKDIKRWESVAKLRATVARSRTAVRSALFSLTRPPT